MYVQPEFLLPLKHGQCSHCDQLAKLMGDSLSCVKLACDEKRKFPGQLLIERIPKFKGLSPFQPSKYKEATRFVLSLSSLDMAVSFTSPKIFPGFFTQKQ